MTDDERIPDGSDSLPDSLYPKPYDSHYGPTRTGLSATHSSTP